MKVSGTVYLTIAILVLITVTIFASTGLPFNWIFFLTVVGQILLIMAVYKVLNSDYSTNKTFKNFYEDEPIDKDDYSEV